jgi:hypothetical protein
LRPLRFIPSLCWPPVVTTCRTATARHISAAPDYWDTAYRNCTGSICTTDGLSDDSLSDGKGLLTDCVIATESFGIGSGVGEYVGWLQDPTNIFHFGPTQSVNEVKIAVDNSAGVGGVGAPSTVVIDGTPYGDPGSMGTSGREIIDIMGLALNSSDITVVLDRSTDAGNFWSSPARRSSLGHRRAKFLCPRLCR